MGFTWVTENQRQEIERQQRECARITSDWVRLARNAEWRRMGLLPKPQQAPE
jgi:hypothetical protein